MGGKMSSTQKLDMAIMNDDAKARAEAEKAKKAWRLYYPSRWNSI